MRVSAGWFMPHGRKHERKNLAVISGILFCLVAGCGRVQPPQAAVPAKAAATPEQQQSDALQAALATKNPGYQRQPEIVKFENGQPTMAEFVNCGVTDISPLAGLPLFYLGLRQNPVRDLLPVKGMPLQELYLEETAVQDLTPLAGMPLRTLYLSHTPVTDLSPLAGIPLSYLNLLGTKVVDLSPLKGMPLDTLWLNETAVADLEPLRGMGLVSLTLHKTAVSNLAPLTEMVTLQRLHLGETAVTDLSPLKHLRLQRLIVTPANIRQGWDVIRNMESLTELDVELGDGPRLRPAEFWQKFDAGAFGGSSPR